MKIKGFIIAGLVSIAVGTGIVVYAATREDFSNVVYDQSYEITNVEYTKEETDKITSISFKAFSDGLVIVPSDTEQIKMDVKSTKWYDYDYSIDEGTHTLVINQKKISKKHEPLISLGSKKHFTIYLPKKLDLTADINAGGLVANDVGFKKANLTVDAGGVELINSSIDELYADVDAGGLEGDNVGFKKANLKIDAGGVELNNSSIDDLYADIDAGGLDLNNCTIGKLEAKVSAGGVDFSGKITTSADFKVSAGGLDMVIVDNKNNYTINGSGTGPVIITYKVSAGGSDIKFK